MKRVGKNGLPGWIWSLDAKLKTTGGKCFLHLKD